MVDITERRKDISDVLRFLSWCRGNDQVPVEIVRATQHAIADDFAPQAIGMALISFVVNYRSTQVDGPEAYFNQCVRRQQVRLFGKPRLEPV